MKTVAPEKNAIGSQQGPGDHSRIFLAFAGGDLSASADTSDCFLAKL
jgi:hypothetical protein